MTVLKDVRHAVATDNFLDIFDLSLNKKGEELCGDKVKFLNQPGGGIVSKIISKTMVNVMIADGFEIPTLTSEL
nr:hypothetical protein [Oscillatoria sp. Prado101]